MHAQRIGPAITELIPGPWLSGRRVSRKTRPGAAKEASISADIQDSAQLNTFHDMVVVPKCEALVRYGPLTPAIGFGLLAGMVWLYATGSDLYGRILLYWSFIPWSHPFIDTNVIPAWIHCWRAHGFVVYTDASWDACGLGPINYSPLWLRLTFLPTDPAWTNWYGLSLVAAFLLSLGLLPQPRHLGERALVVLGTFSCLPVFAMERGNVDLFIFLLAVGAALCLGGTIARRIFAYSLMVLGGLLKFYPLVLLILMLRERLPVFVALAGTAATIVAGTAFVFLDELRQLAPIPSGSPFYNLWSALNLPIGSPTVLRAFLNASSLPAPTAEALSQPGLVILIVAAALLSSMLVMALRLARRDDLRAALIAIPERTYRFLLIGAVLVVGCFFAGQNVGYRGVFLLLILPGILALIHVSASRGLRLIFTMTIGAMLCVLWELTVRHVVADVFGGSYNPVGGSLIGYAIWVVQELAWWWLIMILTAILMRFVVDSPAWRDLGPTMSRHWADWRQPNAAHDRRAREGATTTIVR
jgi:hypothetical protein